MSGPITAPGRANAVGARLERLLNPRGIAIVGASSDPSRIGGQPIRALAEFGYGGRICPVNPKYTEIRGLRCYPDIPSVGQPCDVALIAVPAKLVPQTLEDCGKAGIGFAVVLSAGFREIGERGREQQDALDAAIANSGVRVIGPNCQGMMNLIGRVYCGFGAPFLNPNLKSGDLALVTQSGGFGFGVMGLADAAGIGFSYVISTGNETDIGTLDLMEALIERDDVGMLATYLEGVSDGRRLIRIGQRALDLCKPILVWKVGNSDAGRKAAASHTANLTADYELYRLAFTEGGFIQVRDVDDLVDAARAFTMGRLPEGSNVAVISISGGAGVLLADRCEELGMRLAPLSADTIRKLREFAPEYSSLHNPIDVTAQAVNDMSMLNRSLTAVLKDPGIHQVIVFTASIQGTTAEKVAHEIADIAQRTSKPVLVSSTALPHATVEASALYAEHRIPYYPTPGRAAIGAAAINELAIKRRRVRPGKSLLRVTKPRALDLPAVGQTLGERRSKACLAAYGIPVVREILLDPDAIKTLSEVPFSFPVVVKLDSPDLPHKTEAGAVRIGIQNLDGLKRAADEMLTAARRFKPGARIDGVLVQETASGLEVIAGAVNDPYFGPTVIFGLGGIYSEVLRDVTHRFAPFDRETAREMVREIKGAKLLSGFRGQEPLDVDALADTLSRLSLLAADHAERIAEIDINPLFVRELGHGVVAADALVILRNSSSQTDGPLVNHSQGDRRTLA